MHLFSEHKKEWWKWAAVIAGSLAILWLAVHLLLNVFINGYLERELKSAVHTSTRGAYTLNFEDLDFNIFGRRVEFEGLSLRPDTSSAAFAQLTTFPLQGRLSARSLVVRGLNIRTLLWGGDLNIREIQLTAPSIRLAGNAGPASQSSQGGYKNINLLLFKAVNARMASLRLGSLQLRDAAIELTSSRDNHIILGIADADISVRDIHVDSSTAVSKQLFPADEIHLAAKNLNWNPPGHPYGLKTGSLSLSTSRVHSFIDSLQLIPLHPKHDFSRAVGHETDRIGLEIGRIGIDLLQGDSLLGAGKLFAEKATIQKAEMEIFRDKSLPGAVNRRTELYQTLFRNMEWAVSIDTVSVTDSRITYMEQKPGIPEAGSVTFDNLGATIFPFSNRTGNGNNPSITMQAETDIMGTGHLKVTFNFPMKGTNGYHTATGRLADFAVPELNSMLVPVVFIRASSGYIHSLDFNMHMTDDIAGGELTCHYEDLRISLIDRYSEDFSGSKGLESFLANTFVVKRDNHGSELRKGEIKFERDRQKSVFNFWWKSLLSGLKDTIEM